MMRLLVFSVVVLTSLPLFAQSEQMSPGGQTSLLEKKLENPITVKLNDSEMANLIDTFETKFDIQVHLDQSAIDAGLGGDDLITFKFDGVRMRTALEFFLDKYDCTFELRDNMLILLTKDEAQNHLRMKIYDCRDLLMAIKPKMEDLRSRPRRSGFGGHSVGPAGGVFSLLTGKIGQASPRQSDSGGNSPADSQPQDRKDVVEEAIRNPNIITISPSQQLVSIITESVAPDSWEETEGLGTIKEIGGLLIVTQTEDVHYKIGQLKLLLEKHLLKNSR